MNILFLVSRYPEEKNITILEKDLVKIFDIKGHNCFVCRILEKRFGEETTIFSDGKIKVLKSKVGNISFNVGKFEKGITALTMPFIHYKNILKYFGNEKFDLIISYSPFMSNPTLISKLKKYYNAPAMLVMWDIFPQNAKDLGIIKNKLIFNFFKNKENKMLKIHDLIACNSQGNVDYLLKNYNFITTEKVFTVMNSEFPLENNFEIKNKIELRKQFGYLEDDIILIFGGNIGIPQKLENIMSFAQKCINTKIKFLIIGKGTEEEKIKKEIIKKNQNIKFINYLPSNEYENLIKICDMGIISLNENFTVPNFPAKFTSYIKIGLPIFASLDDCSSKDLGTLIENNNLGLVVSAKDLALGKIPDEITTKIQDSSLRKKMSINAKIFFEKELTVEVAYNKIIEKIKKSDFVKR